MKLLLRRLAPVLMLFSLLLAGCATQQAVPPGTSPGATVISTSVANTSSSSTGDVSVRSANSKVIDIEPLPADVPEAGKATVTGRVVSVKTGKPLGDTPVRLAEVHRQGDEAIYLLSEASSPGAFTNAEGVFIVPNLEAKEYVAVVGDIYGLYVVIPDSSATKPRIWNFEAGQVVQLGELQVDIGL